MFFGRVAKCTINPIGQTSQPSTMTSVALGDWRRFASFIIQIATQSQTPISTIWKRQTTPKPPARSLPLISGVAVSSGGGLCASKVVAVKSSGRPEMSRFIGPLITDFRGRVSME
jgi:hypothetical protein